MAAWHALWPAFGWGLLAGSALVIGAALGYFLRIGKRIVAFVMAFGAGVLISALAFDLMDEALRAGGFGVAALSFTAGSALFTLANLVLKRYGAKHRKRSAGKQPRESEHRGSGLSIALGALMDGIPESVVIGIGTVSGAALGIATVAAVFLSNIPEAMSSSSGMRGAGRSASYVFGVWASIALASGVSAGLGAVFLGAASPAAASGVTAFAAGAILTMLADTMMPEAFETGHDAAGLLTCLGFLAAFGLSHAL